LLFSYDFFNCANEPFARGLPCGKRVRWSSLGRRLNNLARRDTAKLAGTLSTQFFAGKTLFFALHTATGKVIYEIKSTANPQIALSSSTNAVSFSSARTIKRPPSSPSAATTQIVGLRHRCLRYSRNANQLLGRWRRPKGRNLFRGLAWLCVVSASRLKTVQIASCLWHENRF